MQVTEAERSLVEDRVLPALEEELSDAYTVVDLFDEVEAWRSRFEQEIERIADESSLPRITDTPPTCLLSIPRYFVVEEGADVGSLQDLEDATYAAAIDPGLKHVAIQDEEVRDAFGPAAERWTDATSMASFTYLKGEIDISTVTYSMEYDWRFHDAREDGELTADDVAYLVDGPLCDDADRLLAEGYTRLLWSSVFALQALLVAIDEKRAASFFGRVSDTDLLADLVERFQGMGLQCAVRRLEVGEHPPYVELFIARERIEDRPFLEGEMDVEDHRALGRFLDYPEEDVEAFVRREREEMTLREEWGLETGGFDLHEAIAAEYDLSDDEQQKLKALTYYGIRNEEDAVQRALETAQRRFVALRELEDEHGVDVLQLVDAVGEDRSVAGYHDEKQLLDEELLPGLEDELDGLQVVDLHEEMERKLTRLERQAEKEVYTAFMPVIEMPVLGMVRSYSIPEYFVVDADRSVASVTELWEKEYVASIDIGLKHIEIVDTEYSEVFESFGERWEEATCLSNLLGFVKRPIGIAATTYTYR